MVRKIPGTDIEMSQAGGEEIYGRASKRFGFCTALFLLIAVPISIGVVLGALTLGIATLVFAIQGLVVGSATYTDPFLDNCQYTVGVWMIVFGSLTLTNCMISTCCGGGEEPIRLVQIINSTLGFVTFAWLCYGLNIVYNPGRYACSPSQFQVFSLMVQFEFWGMIGLLIALIFLVCLLGPIIAVVTEEKKNEELERLNQDPTQDLEAA